jgi:tetraacyldisaccharide 4'-kinase
MVDSARHGAGDVGDEPLMMAAHVAVTVARDRADGVALAKSQGATVILMDDGFQNPAIVKDVSLIVIDSERGLGNGCVFPAGPLRAPLPPQLARTDALIVIGTGQASEAVAADVVGAGKPVLRAKLQPAPETVVALRGKSVLAFAGIGDPARFFRTLRANGIDVKREQAFADHHPFEPDEIERLMVEAEQRGLTLVTTEKDLVRLRTRNDLASLAAQIVSFPVTLAFDDAAAVPRLLTESLFKARQKAFRKTG